MTDKDFSALPASPSVPTETEAACVASLRAHQTQLDADGCMVGVSRQALDETLALYDEVLSATRSAESLLSGWCERIAEGRSSWDDWDEFYKTAHYGPTKYRPDAGLNERLRAVILKATTASSVGTDERSEEVNQEILEEKPE